MKDLWLLRFSKICIFGVLAVVLFAFILMQLWNWLVPDLFTGPVINFWQALGILVLSKIIFSGFGRKRCPECHKKHDGGFWKQRFQEKMSRMTPEEKERFRERFKGCWSEDFFKKKSDEQINTPG